MSQAGILNIIENNPSIPTQFNGNTGSAIPIGNMLNVVGDNTQGVNVVGSGMTLTISGINASSTQKGVASFDAGDFTVTNGNVTLNESGAGETITGDSGGALSPTAGNWNIIGGSVAAGSTPVATSGAISTLTINVQRAQAIAAGDTTKVGLANFNSTQFSVTNGFVSLLGGSEAIDSFQPDSGTNPVVPNASGLIVMAGSGSLTTVGSLNTLTFQLTGLTNHAVLVGAGTTTITKVGPTAIIGQVLQSAGSSADPAFSTATYPLTTTINQILYSSAANTITGLATANQGVLTTGATGVPVITALATDGQLIIGSTAGVPAASTLTAGAGVTITPGSNSISIAVTGGAAVNSITAGANINLTGTATNPIINVNNQILLPDGTTGAPSYSFTNHPNSGMWENGPNLSFTWQGTEFYRLQGSGNEFLVEVIIESSLDLTYAAPSSWPYTSANDIFISVDTSAARTVNLPNAPRTGRVYIIKDRVGSAATNNITITTPGGTVTFDGTTTYKIVSNFGSVQLMFNGTNYEVY